MWKLIGFRCTGIGFALVSLFTSVSYSFHSVITGEDRTVYCVSQNTIISLCGDTERGNTSASYSSITSGKDTTKTPVDSLQLFMDEYVVNEKMLLDDSIKLKQIENKRLVLLKTEKKNIMNYISLDSLRKEKSKTVFAKTHDSLKVKTQADFNRVQSKCDSSIRLYRTKRQKIDSSIVAEQKVLNQIEKSIRVRTANQAQLKQKIRKQFSGCRGSRNLRFGKVQYQIYVANLKEVDIRTHLFNPSNQKNFYTLGNLKSYLETQNIPPLMMTNAGMYTPNNEPEGLYVENGQTLFPLDTAGANDLNFYLKPNGVFLIDSSNLAHIYTTEEYALLLKNKQLKVKIATQSGPMLVVKDKIHPAFVKSSINEKIRSGVGMISDTKVLFAITLNESNFYNFAVFFKELAGCKNALFLDGAISQMYLKDLAPNTLGGNFGPMLSVTPKTMKK